MGSKTNAVIIIVIVLAALLLFVVHPTQNNVNLLPKGIIVMPYDSWNSYGNGSTINITQPDGTVQMYVDGVQSDYSGIPFSEPTNIVLVNTLGHLPNMSSTYALSFHSYIGSRQPALGATARTFLFYWFEKSDGTRTAKVYGIGSSPEIPIATTAYLTWGNGTLTFTTDKYSSPTAVKGEWNCTLYRMIVGGAYHNPPYYTNGDVQMTYTMQTPQQVHAPSAIQQIIDWFNSLLKGINHG